ncbi:MAG TPA: response regulator [Acidimicrobiales bacterium]|nr:response regulator [Acidimicrobiales bacterium]
MDADEGRRLRALHSLGLLDTPPEERFDRVTRTAQRLLGTPIAMITLVDADRLWFKSRQGTSAVQADKNATFCAQAVQSDQPLAVPDALDDARFAAHDMVTGDPFLRAYAGVPLHAAGGHRVGTLCVFSPEPRTFTAEELDVLRDLARWAEGELDRSELAAALAAQRETEGRLRAFMDAVPEAVAMFDGDGRLLQVNPAGERLFGYRSDQVAGLTIDALLADDTELDELRPQLADLAPGDPPVRLEVDGRHAGGGRIPIEVIVSKATVDGDDRYVVAARDLTERRQAHIAVERLRRQQGLVLEAAAEGICGIDPDGLIVFANPSARRLFGLALEDPLDGVNLHERFHQSYPDGSPYPWEECPTYRTLHGAGPQRIADEVFWDSGGRPFAVEYASAPIVEDGAVTGAVVTFTDVTERRAVERMKNEFVSVVSHELRTPLTSVRGSLGLLASGALGPLGADAQRMAEVAVSSTDRLVRLVNDLLDLERIESGKVQLTLGPVAVDRLLRDAAAAVEGMAERAGVAVRLQPVEGIVNVDADQMLQAIANLLSNAIKFSDRGQAVDVVAERHVASLSIRVVDRGRGIPAEMQDRIFEPFQQVDSSDARERGGTGLGLPIVRSILIRHGGEVTLQSTPGAGSTFTLTVPTAPGREAVPGEGRPRPVVMVVEDDADLAEVLAVSLRRRGVDVVKALTERSAVTLAERVHPDLIVLDVVLSEGDGYGVVEALRRHPAHARTPVLVYTAHNLDDAQRSRLHLGPTEFLLKSGAGGDPLEEKVLTMVGLGAAEQEGRRLLVIDDDPDIGDVARLALEQLGPYTVQTAGSGQEGLRLALDQRPDAILLDVMMPELDGPATLARLRGEEALAGVPVLFLTAKAQASERDRLERLPVSGMIAKPFDPLTLAADVGRLLGWG